MVNINDTLDSDSITEFKIDLKFINGYAFSNGLRIGMGLLGFLGIIALLTGGIGLIIGPILLITSVYVNTATYGTEISLANNYVRQYSTSFGIKKGKWVATTLLPDITVLKMGKSLSFNHAFIGITEGPGSVKIDKDVYEVYLLSANHRKRILIKESQSYNEAYLIATDITEKMGKNLVQFNPVISQATRARRYERH
ncbi:hypothetical protein N8987_00895 [Crocinitomix sp.]|nr:hypothetical protein [Crocinitomix sp.]